MAAAAQIDRLVARGDTLNELAERGRRVPELPHSGLRELIEDEDRIVYRCRGDRVEV